MWGLLLGKRISNTLSSLSKFRHWVRAQPGGPCKLFPGQLEHGARGPTAGVSLVGRRVYSRKHVSLSSRMNDSLTLLGVDPGGWSSIVHSSVHIRS